MIPVLTASEMRSADHSAASLLPDGTLMRRAGAAVARHALACMGGGYGRRVLLVAGPGNNGKDGAIAAQFLRRRGALVDTVVVGKDGNAPFILRDNSESAIPNAESSSAESHIGMSDYDLVVDAAFGIGFRGSYCWPIAASSGSVLAVDIPSGVDADTGEARGGAVKSTWTVTFGAMKIGHCLGQGKDLAGAVSVEQIGIDTSAASCWIVEDEDVADRLPVRRLQDHKWSSAVSVIAGSPGMMGAAMMCAAAAMRSGAGMVRVGIPGVSPDDLPATEAVCEPLDFPNWSEKTPQILARSKAAVVGPGLGRVGGDAQRSQIRSAIELAPCCLIVDADGLWALGELEQAASVLTRRQASTVLTPHWGEFLRLWGDHEQSTDMLFMVRTVASETRSVVLLKGPTTVVADPSGQVLMCTSGSPRLATAGTGDVLSGVIAAFVARGLDPFEAAAFAAHTHGRAAQLGPSEGLTAGDLPELVSRWLSNVMKAKV